MVQQVIDQLDLTPRYTDFIELCLPMKLKSLNKVQFLKYTKAVTCNLIKNDDNDFEDIWAKNVSDNSNLDVIELGQIKSFIKRLLKIKGLREQLNEVEEATAYVDELLKNVEVRYNRDKIDPASQETINRYTNQIKEIDDRKQILENRNQLQVADI